MQSFLAIEEPARQNLKLRLLNADNHSCCRDVDERIRIMENMIQQFCSDMPMDHFAIQACCVGHEIRAIFEEFILDTRAYADHCAKLNNFLHFLPTVPATYPPVSHQGASGWIARIIAIQDDPSTVARVSSLLPGKPEAYLLRSADKEALVQRISTRKQWRSTLVRIWVGEMERFLAMKAFTGDTDASKLSPSGYVDAMWHELIIDTQLYRRHCLTLLGKFIHHNPDGAMDSNRGERYESTLACYRQLFGQEPCSIAWETAAEAAHG